MKLDGNFDPNSKMKWNIGFIQKPGTGPKVKGIDTYCKQCKFLTEQTEPIENTGRVRHFFTAKRLLIRWGRLRRLIRRRLAVLNFMENRSATGEPTHRPSQLPSLGFGFAS